MPSVDTAHRSCADKPLHALTAKLERDHQPLRVELPLVVRLAEETLEIERRHLPHLLSEIHLALCLLRDAISSHFDREEALLFPSVRLIEDGAGAWALDLHRLVPELMREHVQIADLLAQLKLMTNDFVPPSTPSSLRTLYTAMAGVARDLAAHFEIEHERLYPEALTLQRPRADTPEV
jgi:iron-sulfur cluster repair protein YtfE (RIC family)